MARGTRTLSVWDLETSQLQTIRCTFRMCKRKDKKWIEVREIKDGKVVRQFSSRRFRPTHDAEIRECAQECRRAQRRGRWVHPENISAGISITWEMLAANALENLRARIAREGSRKNAEGHLKEIATFTGPVKASRLERWAKERSPIDQPSAFRNRLETISHIDKAGDLDLKATWNKLRALRPTGAAKKEQEIATAKIRAIPTDEALEAWLDSLEGHEQWLTALIATYGLRPSEAWHAEGIDEQGWITIPGEGLTKTGRHFAPPQPAHWAERYQLRENFQKYQAEILERWPIEWSERRGVKIPTNNSKVSNAYYERIKKEFIPRLYVGDDWVRPYDLRHSYAIRCETSLDPALLSTPSQEFADWLGHTLEIHKRVYLKFINPDRERLAKQARVGVHKESPTEAGLTPEILAKLEKLEKLEKLMAG